MHSYGCSSWIVVWQKTYSNYNYFGHAIARVMVEQFATCIGAYTHATVARYWHLGLVWGLACHAILPDVAVLSRHLT